MPTLASIASGAPGLFILPDTPIHRLTGVRLDVCGFAGVAPRGPAREPIVNEDWPPGPLTEPQRPVRRTVAYAVSSFGEYRRLFGGFEGPGLLPYAVATFFENGGKRAYVARILHDYTQEKQGPIGVALNTEGVARGVLPGAASAGGDVIVRGRNEGAWGNRLQLQLQFSSRALLFDPAQTSAKKLTLQGGDSLDIGALLRAIDDSGIITFHFALAVQQSVITLDQALPLNIEALEIVTGSLFADDGDGRSEQHSALGLHPFHPRWMAKVLAYESDLLFGEEPWSTSPILPTDPHLAPPPVSAPFAGGLDRYRDITTEDFFDRLWTLGDDEPGEGVHSFALLSDLAMVAIPDLYHPRPLIPAGVADDPVSFAGPEFRECVEPPPRVEAIPNELVLEKLQLDPTTDFDAILSLHKDLVELADTLRSWIILLDVPPGLSRNRIVNWRNALNSSYAAAYHPWLLVSRSDDARDAMVRIPPSATGAGIIAQTEIAFGVPHGPANVLASAVLDVDSVVSPERHDELHSVGINVYLRERDGVRLSGARTLSRDREYRQLSVRRLMVLLRRTLEQQTQWTVFEPNGNALRTEIRQTLGMFLRQLLLAGAFRGATEEESFFVRCDDTNNPRRISDLGQLIVEVGVAPSEPLEFIVVRISRDGDGSLSIEETV